METEVDDWIHVTEAARILGVHKMSVGYRYRKGLLKWRRMVENGSGRRLAYYSRAEIEAMAGGAAPFPGRRQKPYAFAPTDVQSAYLAGLVDGEGCIRIYHIGPRSAAHSVHYGIMVQISNTKRDMLDWTAAHFGGCVCQARMQREHWVGCLEWKAHCVDAFYVLRAIEPFLITKRPQAQLAIAFQDRMAARPGGNRRVSPEEAAWRAAMCEQMRELNLRGRL